MKKLFISLLAVASVIACTKSNVEFEETTEIGLKPVAHNVTKSMMTENSFVKTDSFNVWAFYKQVNPGTSIADWQAATGVEQTTYIDEKTFENVEGTTTWHGVHSYYWPKVGSLLFAAYYPASISNSVDYTLSDTENKMSITDYQQSRVAATGYAEDFMYANMTASSYSSNNVPLVFKHGLSWITVNLAKSADTPSDATITVTSVKFTDVYPQGDAVVNGTADIVWTPEGPKAAVDVVEKAAELSTTASKLAYEPLFIPQAQTTMEISYNIKSSDGSNFSEVKTVTLNTLKDDASAVHNNWVAGKHYIYTITIGTTEILVAPTVTDWADVKFSYNIG